MRWPPGGMIIGGLKTNFFEICMCLWHIRALTRKDLASGLGIWPFDLARPAPPLRGGRRIDFPKGDHRRPPAFFHSAIWGKAFGIHPLRRSYASSMPFGSLLGRSWRVLSPLDRLLGSLEAFLVPPGDALGSLLEPPGISWEPIGRKGPSEILPKIPKPLLLQYGKMKAQV